MIPRPALLSRKQWHGCSPNWQTPEPVTIPMPTERVWLHHSANDAQGPAAVRQIQSHAMHSNGLADIPYSFVVDADTLVVYEGRGPGVFGGAGITGFNGSAHGICVLGQYDETAPSRHLIDVIGELLAYGALEGWWLPEIRAHADCGRTTCPGTMFWPQIRFINEIAQRYLT